MSTRFPAVSTLTTVAALLAATASASAQPDRSRTGPRSPAADARYQIRVMESVLESAVQHGAQMLTAELRQVSPEMILFASPARARGFRLEGYGAFFSVDVPAVRRSLVWSIRTLGPARDDLGRAMATLKQIVEAQADARSRSELERALRLVELQVGPLPASARRTGDQATGPVAVATDLVESDPNQAYEAEVKQALIDAMIDYGPPLNIGADEWLTIAARDDTSSDRLLPGEVTDTVTVMLRVRGADLGQFRQGRLTRDEMRQRVEVKEF